MMSERSIAFNCLCKIINQKGYSQLVLKEALANVDEKQRPFITTLVYGTIQNYYYDEYMYMKYVPKKVDDKKIKVLLNMATYELCFMKTPSYAIIDEANELAKKKVNKRYASFVNGVLRNVDRNEALIEEADPIKHLAIETSHPEWLLRMWNKQYGEEIMRKIAYADNEKPRNVARYNRLKTTKEELKKAYDFKDGLLSEDALYLDGGNLAALKEYQEGKISIQDESSQMVAIVADPKEGDHILDVCAAPGSKSMHMAERMHNQGHIIAHDLHESRVDLMREGAARLGISNIEFKVFDSTKCHEEYTAESFDIVVVDAPCSGLGVLGRKPDIRLQNKSDSMDEIIKIQHDILESVSELVKVNGKLIYSTCSLNKKENDRQVEEFVAKHENYKLDMMKTIFPYEYHSDGFFIARLIRVK